VCAGDGCKRRKCEMSEKLGALAGRQLSLFSIYLFAHLQSMDVVNTFIQYIIDIASAYVASTRLTISFK